jgi:hypothetical protein
MLTGLFSAALLLAFAASPVLAKFPPFSVELDPAQPVAGQPVTVVVHLWDDAEHTKASTFPIEGEIPGMLEFRPVDGAGPEAAVPVTLRHITGNRLEGSVTLAAGQWRLVAFPHGSGASEELPPGYPGPIALAVAGPGDPTPGLPPTDRPGQSLHEGLPAWMLASTLVGALVSVLLVLIGQRRGDAPA